MKVFGFIVMNSLLGNFKFGIGLQCRALLDLGQIFVANFHKITYPGVSHS